MHHHAAAFHVAGLAVANGEGLGLPHQGGGAGGVSHQAGQVAHVHIRAGLAVLVAGGVVVAASAHRVWGRAVAVFVDVKAVLAVRRQAFDLGDHAHGVFIGLEEADIARKILHWTKDKLPEKL